MHRPFSRHARSIPPSIGGSRPAVPTTGTDLRCACHRLLARAVPTGIELRCPRCKTDMVLTWERVRAMEATGESIEL